MYAYRQYKSYSWLKEISEITVHANEFKTHIKAVEVSHRNYIITSNLQYSEAYRRNVNLAFESLEKIEVYRGLEKIYDHPLVNSTRPASIPSRLVPDIRPI